MNQVIETIEHRRSVRSFAEKQIPNDIMEQLVHAAACAPSGTNAQPWRFVVVQDKAFRKKLAEISLPRYQAWLANMPVDFKEMRKAVDAGTPDPTYYGAPAIVFVIGKGMTADFDCSMACQNLMLAARSLGIGSCWVYIGQLAIGDPGVRSALELAEGEKVYGPIVLGYPKEGFPEAPPKKPLAVKWI